MKCYFEKLNKPLVTNKSLEDLFSNLKDNLSKKKMMKKSPSQMLNVKSLNPSFQFMKTKLTSY